MQIDVECLEDWNKKQIEEIFGQLSQQAVVTSKKLKQKQYKSLYQHPECPIANDSDYPEVRAFAEEDAKLRVTARKNNVCWSQNAWREYLIYYGVCLEKFKDQE
jgi:hypothetical protein